MEVIYAKDVDDALFQGLGLMTTPSKVRTLKLRYGDVIECLEPVTTVYTNPQRRVLFNEVRDANPFFHLMESLWILAGRADVRFLKMFNSRMGEFSDDGVSFHAPYGYRIRSHFEKDQIKECVDLFKKDINTNRAVLQVWDCDEDLNFDSKDIPCNDLVFLKVREDKLHITVCCRSNDVIWGAYGANVVQFSMLQEYIAGHLGVGVGEYRQISDSYHIYDTPKNNEIARHEALGEPYFEINTTPLLMGGGTMEQFDEDLVNFFDLIDDYFIMSSPLRMNKGFKTRFFSSVVWPMFINYKERKDEGVDTKETVSLLRRNMPSTDWQHACIAWLQRRVK